jgi:hypothetical protein
LPLLIGQPTSFDRFSHPPRIRSTTPEPVDHSRRVADPVDVCGHRMGCGAGTAFRCIPIIAVLGERCVAPRARRRRGENAEWCISAALG